MASKQNRSNTASMLHSIAEELGCAPELVGVVKKELRLRSRKDILHATQERLAQMAEADAPADATTPPVSDESKPKKERKASLTLSQRRALLKLLGSIQVPPTDFKALPYEHLVEVGYAARIDSDSDSEDTDARPSYELTTLGRARAEGINPGYLVWSAGETVAGDESRPPAGTKRSQQPDDDEKDDDGDAPSETPEAVAELATA